MTIQLIEILRDGLFGTYGNMWLVLGATSLMVFLLFVYVTRARVITSLIMTAVPFILASIAAIINIDFVLPIFTIVVGLMLAFAFTSMLSTAQRG